MIQKMKPFLIVFAVLFFIWLAYGFFSIWRIEKPVYTLVSKNNSFEIRDYESFIVAQTKVKSKDYNDGLNEGFRIVANYIFGDNVSQSKIAMTTPVVSEMPVENQEKNQEKIAMTTPVVSEMSGDSMLLYFVMPSEYSLQSLPTPKDDRISLIEMGPQRRLVFRFSGWLTSSRLDKKIEILKAHALSSDLKIGPIQVAQYNPPWTPPFMKRNEIWAALTSY